MIRALGLVCAALLLAQDANGQDKRAIQLPLLSNPFGALSRDTVPSLAARLARFQSLLAATQRTAADSMLKVACPMPVSRSGPSVDAMPRALPDTTVAPAVSRAVILTSCYNERFR